MYSLFRCGDLVQRIKFCCMFLQENTGKQVKGSLSKTIPKKTKAEEARENL